MLLKLGTAVLLLAALANANNTAVGPKVLCYYDGTAATRGGIGTVTVEDIEPALPYCTHLVYGFAGIDPDSFKLRAIFPERDLDAGKGQFRQVTSLKRRYPGLKVLLSVGGYKDRTEENPLEKYLTLLENGQSRTAFVNSAYSLLKAYDFDGLDLAWQFPQTKPKRIRGTAGTVWHGFKKLFTGDSVLDPKAEEHREEFTVLVRDLKNSFVRDNYLLGLTVLPHVNDTMFLDIPLLTGNLDYVHLAAFDQQTPERNPKEGDFTAPIYEPAGRVVGNNIDAEAKHWLAGGTPASKIIIGIPSYTRAWLLTKESSISGVPPIVADGPAPPGPETHTAGVYSWSEVCITSDPQRATYPLRQVRDPLKRFGSYSYRVPDKTSDQGIWLSYDDPDSAGNKAAYVKAKSLGGISIFDLGNDDARGTCDGTKFPILKAAKNRL